MKILLVAPSIEVFPVGMAYIASSLKSAGHDVDCCVFGGPNDLRFRLGNKHYDLVGTGGLSNQYWAVKKISDIVKACGVKLLAGGGIITSEPELMSRDLCVDYAVIGEGEEASVELLECLQGKRTLSDVEGIGYFSRGVFLINKARKQTNNLDALPLPDYDAFDYNGILNKKKPSDQYLYDLFDFPREYPLITSRSCPFRCTFCYHPLGDKYRQRSIDSVIAELKVVVPRYRINIISVYDELFSYDEARVHEFCKRLKEIQATVPWEIKWSCQMRVSKLKNSMLESMREAGCYMISYGFESYNSLILKSMKKETSPEEIHNAVHATLDKKISIQAAFIFGDTAETIDTAKTTLDFWKEHAFAGIILSFVQAYPNSPIYQYCLKNNLIKDRLDFIKYKMSDILNMTKIPQVEFFKLRVQSFSYRIRHSVYAFPVTKTASGISLVCPHCKEVVRYDNFAVPKIICKKMMYCRNCRKRFIAVNRLTKLINAAVLCVPTLAFLSYLVMKRIVLFVTGYENTRIFNNVIVPLQNKMRMGKANDAVIRKGGLSNEA